MRHVQAEVVLMRSLTHKIHGLTEQRSSISRITQRYALLHKESGKRSRGAML